MALNWVKYFCWRKTNKLLFIRHVLLSFIVLLRIKRWKTQYSLLYIFQKGYSYQYLTEHTWFHHLNGMLIYCSYCMLCGEKYCNSNWHQFNLIDATRQGACNLQYPVPNNQTMMSCYNLQMSRTRGSLRYYVE